MSDSIVPAALQSKETKGTDGVSEAHDALVAKRELPISPIPDEQQHEYSFTSVLIRPVLIDDQGIEKVLGVGTGFTVVCDSHRFLVTCRHMRFADTKCTKAVSAFRVFFLGSSGKLKSPEGDLIPLYDSTSNEQYCELGGLSWEPVIGKFQAKSGPPDIIAVNLPATLKDIMWPDVSIETSVGQFVKSLRPGSRILVPGFPSGVGFDYKPVWKSCFVASDFGSSKEMPLFLMDGTIKGGLSGSPVFRFEDDVYDGFAGTGKLRLLGIQCQILDVPVSTRAEVIYADGAGPSAHVNMPSLEHLHLSPVLGSNMIGELVGKAKNHFY